MESITNQHKSLKATLDERKDHRYILLIYARDDAQHYSIDQQEQLNAVRDQLAEREIDVIVLIASTLMEPDRWFLMHTEGYDMVPQEDFTGWIIDKDGSVQHRFTQPISPDELFRLVEGLE